MEGGKGEKGGASEERFGNFPNFENMESFGYTMLQKPLEALNIVYPLDNLNELIDNKNYDFDSKELVGKEGLNRIMSYKQTTNPPSRYDFEYKETRYGNIFSLEEIGKYSTKIEKICYNIISSTGVILIYSQYIDGGVVPIALALEELGFTRAGRSRSLLKNPPEQLDVNTNLNKSRFKEETVNKIFTPAKYIMITGDKSLSPDNAGDIKAVTNKDNYSGEKIRVIIISQAGSEGLDFKYIRQVHILEPWYNMNRIEQIIGRAVRWCSHKDLPFIERNVQIFLYGTLLNTPNEAADLYVYRVAEHKSLQIGQVTRILKESSVDCILNQGQNNFTEENMNKMVDQRLANRVIIQYKVGDKPFTSTCDYMERCSYTCYPDKNLDELEINDYTYNEAFIITNNEKIIQRIKQLMREEFFYNKIDLLKLISIKRNYPIDQIYSALTQLIEDNSELILDKYGRLGNLINIGDLYLFQPNDITNNRISLYDRSVPIEYKHANLKFNVPKLISEDTDILEEPGNEEPENEEPENEEPENDKKLYIQAKNIIQLIKKNFNFVLEKQNIIYGEKNEYKLFSIVLENLAKDGISIKLLHEFIIYHIIDLLNYDDNLLLLNYLYNNKLDSFEKDVKSYYDKYLLKNKDLIGVLLQNKSNQKLLIFKNKIWVSAESEDYKDLIREIESKIIIKINTLNNLVGYIGNFKDEYNIFKVKQMSKKRHKGARCDQTTKPEALKMLNDIIGHDKYINKDTGGKLICLYQEMYMRYNDHIKKDNKKWFITPIQAIINDIEKIAFKN